MSCTCQQLREQVTQTFAVLDQVRVLGNTSPRNVARAHVIHTIRQTWRDCWMQLMKTNNQSFRASLAPSNLFSLLMLREIQTRSSNCSALVLLCHSSSMLSLTIWPPSRPPPLHSLTTVPEQESSATAAPLPRRRDAPTERMDKRKLMCTLLWANTCTKRLQM